MLQIYIVVADLHYSFKLRNFKGSIIYPVILSSMYNHDDETVDKQMKHQLKEDYIYKQDFFLHLSIIMYALYIQQIQLTCGWPTD